MKVNKLNKIIFISSLLASSTVVAEQVRKGLDGLGVEKALAVTIAYEPVWAIGTGKTATPEQAQQVHEMIRQLLADIYGPSNAQEIRIQYGGSAKPTNTPELMAKPDIDGLLVGGASLNVDDFADMIKTAAKMQN